MDNLWIRLANTQIAPRLTRPLFERFATIEALFEASESSLHEVAGMTDGFAKRLLDPTFNPTQTQLDTMSDQNIGLVSYLDPPYPKKLKEIVDPPPALFVKGRLDPDDQYSVGVVGSRQATHYGRSVAAKLSRDLARNGLVIISGGAIGIDTASHQAAFDAGGRTLVVLGCGLDIRYPESNQRLFSRIVESGRGAIVSEFPMGAAPEAWRFPMRNRLISGMSLGVIVVEAGVQSGALLTASVAAEQGRDVMAVPGNIDQDMSKGCNSLIRDGAILVENAEDVFRTLGVLTLQAPQEAPRKAPSTANLPEAQRKILERLSLQPKHVDSLAADMEMPAHEVGVQMTLLELSGLVRRLPGNCYVRML